jgi:hypothetical protein
MTYFRKAPVCLIAAVLALGLLSLPAAAQINQITIMVDENGNGTINGFTGLQPLAFSMMADPGPGGLASVLAYNLFNPPGLIGGDVALDEVGSVSDLLRFDPNVNGGTLFFYSDIDLVKDGIADVGLPGAFNRNFVSLNEVALPGGGFGAIYTPNANQPGFVTGAAVPVSYTFISDAAVPEPATFLLMLPAAAFFIRRRIR